MSESYELHDSQYPREQNRGLEQPQHAGDDVINNEQQNDALDIMSRPPIIRTTGPLTTFDVFSFIVNNMVGTGIFTAPSAVLSLTADWRIAVTLWAAAFLYNVITCA